MERGESSRSRHYSRREVLKLGAVSTVAIGGLYISGKMPRIGFLERPPLEEYDSQVEEIRILYPNTGWIDHNAGNNPYSRKAALEGPAKNIETDAIDFDSKPVIAHSIPEFKRDVRFNPDLLELQNAGFVFREIIENGKNPVIDIKPQNQEGFERLMEAVNENIPEDVVVTFSGEPSYVLQAAERRNSILLPTYQPWEIDEYTSNADGAWKDFDPEFYRFGASFGPNFSDRDLRNLLNYNLEHELDLESNIWIVDDPKRMLTLLRWGATFITTNNRTVIGKAMSIN